MSRTDPRLIRLSDADNVLMIAETLPEGAHLSLDDTSVTLAQSLSLGHKLAATDIAKGQTITKYNFPIGVATEDIAKGAHVHVHNMRSDYTATYIIPKG